MGNHQHKDGTQSYKNGWAQQESESNKRRKVDGKNLTLSLRWGWGTSKDGLEGDINKAKPH